MKWSTLSHASPVLINKQTNLSYSIDVFFTYTKCFGCQQNSRREYLKIVCKKDLNLTISIYGVHYIVCQAKNRGSTLLRWQRYVFFAIQQGTVVKQFLMLFLHFFQRSTLGIVNWTLRSNIVSGSVHVFFFLNRLNTFNVKVFVECFQYG